MKPAAADSSSLPAERKPDATKEPSAKSLSRPKSSLIHQKTDESSEDPKQSKLPKVQPSQQASSVNRSLSTLHADSRKSIVQGKDSSEKMEVLAELSEPKMKGEC